jgi:hypothetical protein
MPALRLSYGLVLRAAERVQTATAMGLKQAAQGIKSLTGGPLSVCHQCLLQYAG